MSWSRVQGIAVQAGAVSTINLTLPSTVTNGNIVVGAILCPTDSYVTSITDDKGNVYKQIASSFVFIPSGPNNSCGFYSASPLTNTPRTVTVTIGGSGAPGSFLWGICDEFSLAGGIPAVSGDGFITLVSSANASTQTFTTNNNGNLIYNAGFSLGALTAGSGFTAGTGSGNTVMSEYQTQSSAGLAQGIFSVSNTTWMNCFAISPIARTGFEVVQTVQQHLSIVTTSQSFAMPMKVTPGNFLVGILAIADPDFTHITALGDDKGNSYLSTLTLETPQAFANARGIFWSNGLLFNSPQTITCTSNISETGGILWQIAEVAPPPGTASVFLDAQTTSVGNPSSPPISPPAITPTQAGEFFFSVVDAIAGNATTHNNATPSFSILQTINSTWCAASYYQPAKISTTSTFDTGAGNSQLSLVAFGAVASPSSTGGGRQVTEEEVRKYLTTENAISMFSKRGAQARKEKYLAGRTFFR